MAKTPELEKRRLPGDSGEKVPGTNVPTWQLDARAPRKFATKDGPGRRVYGSITVRKTATYKVFVEGPDGTQRLVAEAAVTAPGADRFTSLRIMVDATEAREV